MKRTCRARLHTLMLLYPLLLTAVLMPASSVARQKQAVSASPDALWINIIPSQKDFRPNWPPPDFYLDLQSDGKFLFASGYKFGGQKSLLRGTLPRETVLRAFHIVSQPSVLNARDIGPGEPIFSDSDWVSIGLMVDGQVKAQGGWVYQEELKDYPLEFQKLLAELKSAAEKMAGASNIKMLFSAQAVDKRRLKYLDPDGFITLDEASLNALPSLRRAIETAHRMVAIEDDGQMRKLAELARQKSQQAAYTGQSPFWGLYRIAPDQYYELDPYYWRP